MMKTMRDATMLLVLLVLAASIRVTDKPAPVAEFSRAAVLPSVEWTASAPHPAPDVSDTPDAPRALTIDGSERILVLPGISQEIVVTGDAGEVLLVLKPMPTRTPRRLTGPRPAMAVQAESGSCAIESIDAVLEEHARRVLVLEVDRDHIERRTRTITASLVLDKA
jgi:hypothetical protein